MTFNPSQVRATAGTADGGQWVSAAAAKKAAASSKKTPAASTTKKSASSSKAPKLGAARDAAAAKIQQDPAAQKMYEQLMGMQGTARAAYVKKLPPDQLEKLTAIVYSSHTSDPAVVQARIAVANEMTKRGLDIKKFGALGGGMTTSKASPATAAKKTAVQWAAKKAAPKAAAPSPAAKAAVTARAGSQVISATRVRAQ